MPQAKLTLDLPQATWINQVSKAYSDSLFRIVAALAGETKGVGLIEIQSENIDEVLEEIENHGEIEEFKLLQQSDGEALVEFETINPILLFAAKGSGIPLETPFDIQDGKVEWEITTSHERLSELSEQLNNFGISFDVEYIRDMEHEQILTDRQEELLMTAVEEGYYDTPRRCSLSDLSETLGISKSTCSETLHRAEEKVIKRFFENL